ncbi:MAG: divalent-cation tolerance protein CutA [Armatimonadetes bacterium]|nr:divalent-cation tolerance protein CutA [Armatimonadota bacterium]
MSAKKEYIIILVTASKEEEAKKIAAALLKVKLAACINLLNHVRSIYWWKNKIETSKEVLMIIKAEKTKFKSIMKKIKENHSYSVPEIISLPIVQGNKEYLKWISKI